MNHGRAYHASCIAGNTMYVYKGLESFTRDYIEMLKIDEEVLNREVLKSSGDLESFYDYNHNQSKCQSNRRRSTDVKIFHTKHLTKDQW